MVALPVPLVGLDDNALPEVQQAGLAEIDVEVICDARFEHRGSRVDRMARCGRHIELATGIAETTRVLDGVVVAHDVALLFVVLLSGILFLKVRDWQHLVVVFLLVLLHQFVELKGRILGHTAGTDEGQTHIVEVEHILARCVGRHCLDVPSKAVGHQAHLPVVYPFHYALGPHRIAMTPRAIDCLTHIRWHRLQWLPGCQGLHLFQRIPHG